MADDYPSIQDLPPKELNGYLIDPDLQKLIKEGLEKAAETYFRDFAHKPMPAGFTELLEYEQAFGAYVLTQNPYADLGHISRPTIPVDTDTETRWVRKSGVLRDFTAIGPLLGDMPIPAGDVVPFTFEAWDGLLETASTTDPGPGSKTNEDGLPSNHTEIYNHRVVKFVRFRYTVNDRRQNGDKQVAYLLCLFSGGDH